MGKAKKEFAYKLGALTGQGNRRHALLEELSALPEATTDNAEGVQQLLVDDEWYDYLFARWTQFCDLAATEKDEIDDLLRLVADEPKMRVSKYLLDELHKQSHECVQAILIGSAFTLNMEAAKAGLTLEDFMERRTAQ